MGGIRRPPCNPVTLSQAYFNRGSAREAEYFAQQAQDMAEVLNAPAMMSRALVRKGRLHQGQLEEGYESLRQAEISLHDMSGTDTADIHSCEGNTAIALSSPKWSLTLSRPLSTKRSA